MMNPSSLLAVLSASCLLVGCLAVGQPFPFSACKTSPSPYSVAPLATAQGSNTFCVTLKVQNQAGCTDKCCRADIRKFEVNVNSECDVSGLRLSATLNGRPLRTLPSIDPAPNKNNGTVLRITNLALSLGTVDGAELCFTLNTNSAGAGCVALQTLCVPPAGAPAGNCSAALYDTTLDCCPVSTFALVAGPTPACDVCFDVELEPPPFEILPYRFTAASCLAYQTAAANLINGLIQSSGTPYTRLFAPDASRCGALKMSVCGGFATTAGAKALEDEISASLPLLVRAAVGSTCNPELAGYTVVVSTSSGSPAGHRRSLSHRHLLAEPSCISVDGTEACALPPTPPNCTCNFTQGILPYVIAPRYTIAFSNATSSLFCFQVTTIDKLVPSSCRGADPLSKIEIYANSDKRSAVRSITITPSPGTGRSATLSPSWSGNFIKVTPINWTRAQAANASVCLDIRKPMTLEELCFGTQCYVAPFSSARCCPTFRTALAP